MKYRIILGLIVLASIALIDLFDSPTANATPSIFSEYPVPGSPLFVAVESPNRIWFTLPAQNQIGLLNITSTVDYRVVTFTVPTAASEPYRIKYNSGNLWFTERLGNKIGRLDASTGTIDEFNIPTLDSQPTGVTVFATSPLQVWFTERMGNQLGKLVVTSTLDYTVTEYPLPASQLNSQPEDLDYDATNNRIWFTAPTTHSLGIFWIDTVFFLMLKAGTTSQPWSTKIDSGNSPWLTDLTANRAGLWYESTVSNFYWYPLPLPNSAPFGLEIAQGYYWVTEQDGNRIAQLDSWKRKFREMNLAPASAPKGIAADGNGCLWVAESGTDKLASWCPPYFYSLDLPLIMR